MSSEPHPKPDREQRPRGGRTLRSQVYDPDASKRKILAERECRIADCGEAPGGCHHLVAKGGPHYGDDVEDNLIPLCGTGTTGHHGKVEAYDRATCAEVGFSLSEAETAYVLRKMGDDPGRAYLLNRYRLMVPIPFVYEGEEL